MKRIGTTSAGTIIVEMTSAEFDAAFSKPKASAADQPVATKMTIEEKVIYVRERIAKLAPKKKEGVIHSISAMFQFTGGVDSDEIEGIITLLQKEKFFSVSETGRVTYEKSIPAPQLAAPKRRS